MFLHNKLVYTNNKLKTYYSRLDIGIYRKTFVPKNMNYLKDYSKKCILESIFKQK